MANTNNTEVTDVKDLSPAIDKIVNNRSTFDRMLNLGSLVKRNVDRMQMSIVTNSTIGSDSNQLSQNFKIIGKQIGAITTALVKSDKRITVVEKSVSDRIGQVSKLISDQTRKVALQVDNRIDSVESSINIFDDRIETHDRQIDRANADIALLKKQIAEKKTEKPLGRNVQPNNIDRESKSLTGSSLLADAKSLTDSVVKGITAGGALAVTATKLGLPVAIAGGISKLAVDYDQISSATSIDEIRNRWKTDGFNLLEQLTFGGPYSWEPARIKAEKYLQRLQQGTNDLRRQQDLEKYNNPADKEDWMSAGPKGRGKGRKDIPSIDNHRKTQEYNRLRLKIPPVKAGFELPDVSWLWSNKSDDKKLAELNDVNISSNQKVSIQSKNDVVIKARREINFQSDNIIKLTAKTIHLNADNVVLKNAAQTQIAQTTPRSIKDRALNAWNFQNILRQNQDLQTGHLQNNYWNSIAQSMGIGPKRDSTGMVTGTSPGGGPQVGGYFGDLPSAPTTGEAKWNVMKGKDWKQEAKNITTLKTPYGNINVHKDAAGAFEGFYEDLHKQGTPLEKLGSYNVREKRWGGGMSMHSYGYATDMDDAVNLSPKMKQWVQENPERWQGLLQKYGMKWNPGNKDPGHVEWGGVVSPEAAKEFEERNKNRTTDQRLAKPNAGNTGFRVDPNSKSRINELQQDIASIRKGAIKSDLKDQLEYAAQKNGVFVEVVSGGQRMEGAPGATGSHRHDHGGAADLKLYTIEDGKKRYLNMNNPNDVSIMKQFTSDSVAAGASGVGAGLRYMGAETLHIGGGKATSWGGAPWIGEAHQQGLLGREQFKQNKQIVPQAIEGDPFGRGRHAIELSNPSVKEHMLALTLAEVGNNNPAEQRALMESILNRTNAQKKNSVMDTMGANYYQPMQNGGAAYYAALSRLRKDPELRKNLEQRFEEVMKGSNDSNFGTHNSSAGVAANARKSQTISAEFRETFSRKDNINYKYLHGARTVNNEAAWYAATKKAVEQANSPHTWRRGDILFKDRMKKQQAAADRFKPKPKAGTTAFWGGEKAKAKKPEKSIRDYVHSKQKAKTAELKYKETPKGAAQNEKPNSTEATGGDKIKSNKSTFDKQSSVASAGAGDNLRSPSNNRADSAPPSPGTDGSGDYKHCLI